MAWNNNDGLNLRYGTEKTGTSVGGEYVTTGALREIEVKLTMTQVGTSPGIVSEVIHFPKDVRIEEVDLITNVVTTGASSTLNVGLVRYDRSTEIDYQAFLKAIPLTSMDAAGEKTTYKVGTAGAGDLMGTVTAFPGYITADWDTAAFSAGVVTIRIRYSRS